MSVGPNILIVTLPDLKVGIIATAPDEGKVVFNVSVDPENARTLADQLNRCADLAETARKPSK